MNKKINEAKAKKTFGYATNLVLIPQKYYGGHIQVMGKLNNKKQAGLRKPSG